MAEDKEKTPAQIAEEKLAQEEKARKEEFAKRQEATDADNAKLNAESEEHLKKHADQTAANAEEKKP